MPRSLITFCYEGGPNDGQPAAVVLDHPEHCQAFDEEALCENIEYFNAEFFAVSQLPNTFFPMVWDENGDIIEVKHIQLGESA